MPARTPRQTLKKIVTVYFPLVVGVILTALGALYFIEVSQAQPAIKLPHYGILPFSSREFGADLITFEVTSISLEGGYVDFAYDAETYVKEGEETITFGLQMPYKVDGAFFKVVGLDNDKKEVYYTGDAEVRWMPEKDISIIYYEFQPQSKYPYYRTQISGRWSNPVIKRGYSSFELMVPFSNSDSDALEGVKPGMFWIYPNRNNTSGDLKVSLKANLPIGSEITESVPQLKGEVIYWTEQNGGHRSVVLEDQVGFGRPYGNPVLQSFRIEFEQQSLREQYDRLVFNSGLFLGVGIQFLIAGLYDAIKLKEK